LAELAGRAFTKKGDMDLIGDSLYSTYTRLGLSLIRYYGETIKSLKMLDQDH
jgi:hypothetical protein